MVNIHVPGFQTIDIFMQTGVQEKPVAALNEITDIVKDSPQKVLVLVLLYSFSGINYWFKEYFYLLKTRDDQIF